MLPCNFIKTGFHGRHFRENVPTFFDQALSQYIYELLNWKGCTTTDFTILLKFHKSLEGVKQFARSIL